MPQEMHSYYLLFRNNRYVAIDLIHYENNKWAAYQAMMAAFGLSKSDIKSESGGSASGGPSWAKTNPCQVFDGRNAH